MRVAAVIDTAILSGPGRQLAALALALAKKEISFLVVVIQRADSPVSSFTEHLNELRVDYTIVFEDHPFDIAVFGRVKKVLTNFAPDIVQSHGYKPTVILAVLRIFSRWKWIGFWHGSTSEDFKVKVYHLIDLTLLRFADCVAIVAEAHRHLFPMSRQDVVFVPNAVIPLPASHAANNGFLCGLTYPVIAVVGRLSFEKGVDVFLQAIPQLLDDHPNLTALIVGDGPERENLEKQSLSLGIRERVHFAGIVRNLTEVYETTDVVVIPSRSEGFPNVLIEALASGASVVATSVGEIPRIIESPLVGILIEPGSPTAIVIGINDALGAGRSAHAVAARREALAPYSLDARVVRHNEMYSRVLKSPEISLK